MNFYPDKAMYNHAIKQANIFYLLYPDAAMCLHVFSAPDDCGRTHCGEGNALPPPVSYYPQINVNSKRKKNQKRKSSNSINEEYNHNASLKDCAEKKSYTVDSIVNQY
jgi:hypothetical protein